MKEITINNETFEYKKKDEDEKKTILDFLEEKGVSINYQCRDGYCGVCRCSLLEGTVETNKDAIGFKLENEFLACSSYPKTNIVIKK